MRLRAIVAAALMVLVMTGQDDCGGSGGETTTDPVAESAARLKAYVDSIINADSDRDTVPDTIDRRPGRDDLGDDDGDGWANWIDIVDDTRVRPAPRVPPRASVPSATTQYQTPDAAHQAQRNTTDRAALAQLEGQNNALRFFNQQLDRQARNSDRDSIPDLWDTQPFLDFGGDQDGDNVTNGRDRFPLNEGYE